VLRSHHHPELETYKRRLRRTKRKLAEYAAENTELRRRLGEEGAEGEGEGLKALGLLASRVLESETPKRKLGSPVAFKGAKRRRSRDSTISVEDPEEVDGSPSPRKRVKTAPGLGTPVSPHPSRAQREK